MDNTVFSINDSTTSGSPPVKTWDDLDIKPDLLRGIYAYGFEYPSEIQKKAIPALFSGKDIIAQAQSGTGKTGTFSIGALQHVDTTSQTTQIVIMSPTRELATQISNVITAIGSHIPSLNTKIIIGGSSIQKDIADIREQCPHIIIGCP